MINNVTRVAAHSFDQSSLTEFRRAQHVFGHGFVTFSIPRVTLYAAISWTTSRLKFYRIYSLTHPSHFTRNWLFSPCGRSKVHNSHQDMDAPKNCLGTRPRTYSAIFFLRTRVRLDPNHKPSRCGRGGYPSPPSHLGEGRHLYHPSIRNPFEIWIDDPS